MINIAELLKDAPSGMKLYSPLFGEVTFCRVEGNNIYVVLDQTGCSYTFSEHGKPFHYSNAECLLFPSKEVRTWEGWKAPIEPKFKVGDWITGIDDEGDMATEKIVSFSHNKVLLVDTDGCRTEYPKTELNGFRLWSIEDAKDGDVLAINWHEDDDSWEKIVIFKKYHNKGVKGLINRSCVEGYGNTFKNGKLAFNEEVPYYSKTWTYTLQPANTKQRDLLFQKMKENGYEWDFEKKELKKIQPHYDISNFKPFDKVLVRCADDEEWAIEMFSKYYDSEPTIHGRTYRFMCIADSYTQCIPFEGNEHLLGTTDMPDEMYINW